MAKFDVSEHTEKLEFDFSAFDGPAGVIPEPSDQQIIDFTKVIDLVQEKAGTTTKDDGDGGGRRRLIAETMASNVELLHLMTDAVAEVCTNIPTSEEITKLPFRVRMLFLNWVMDELLSPEGSTPGTSTSPGESTTDASGS